MYLFLSGSQISANVLPAHQEQELGELTLVFAESLAFRLYSAAKSFGRFQVLTAMSLRGSVQYGQGIECVQAQILAQLQKTIDMGATTPGCNHAEHHGGTASAEEQTTKDIEWRGQDSVSFR